METSNTGTNRKGTFKKGDPRINRKGRPKSFDALRELAQQIAHETITEVNGHKATVAEMILRKWASSTNPQLQRAFIEVAFGKVPDNIHLSGPGGEGLAIRFLWVDEHGHKVESPTFSPTEGDDSLSG